eukprot:snap_masked-scaffold_77-processed-gene-0.21-mRNA-1 protein AED:0.01 eAED:0.06 QI:0/-1/0/1/-1/1/1/0/305
MSVLLEVASGGLAASASVIITNPLDVIKTRMQMNKELTKTLDLSYRNSFHCLQETYRAEGILGVQRGLRVAVLREFAKCCFRIGMYDPIKRSLQKKFIVAGKSSQSDVLVVNILAASFCGAVSAILCNPLDLVKTRTQASSSKLSSSHHDISANTSFFKTVRQIISENKSSSSWLRLSPLWYGTSVNVLRSICFTGVMLPSNTFLIEMNYFDAFSFVMNPMISSAFGIYVMNPVDVVRTRVYNQNTIVRVLYKSPTDCVSKILKQEGLAAFWKGVVGHYFRVAPHTVLTLIFMEKIRTHIFNIQT